MNSFDIDSVNDEIRTLKDEVVLLRRQKDYLSKKMYDLSDQEEKLTIQPDIKIQSKLLELKLQQSINNLEKILSKKAHVKDPKLFVENYRDKLTSFFNESQLTDINEVLDNAALNASAMSEQSCLNALKSELFELKNKLHQVQKDARNQFTYFNLLSKCEVDLKLDVNKLIEESRKQNCLGMKTSRTIHVPVQEKNKDATELTQSRNNLESLQVPKSLLVDELDQLINRLETKIRQDRIKR